MLLGDFEGYSREIFYGDFLGIIEYVLKDFLRDFSRIISTCV